MKPYFKNPRKITEDQLTQLRETMAELGDLGGIVHDLNSNEIIGGNQRSEVFKAAGAETFVEDEHEPTEKGTVALGYIDFEGEHFPYRQVRWTPEQCEKANIVANKLGGNWDWDILANQFEETDLLNLGFVDFDFDKHTEDFEGKNAEVDVDNMDDTCELKFTLSSEDYEEIKAVLREYNDDPNIAIVMAFSEKE